MELMFIIFAVILIVLVIVGNIFDMKAMDNLSRLGQDRMMENFDKYFFRGVHMREENFNDEGIKYRKYFYRIVTISVIFFIVFGFILAMQSLSYK